MREARSEDPDEIHPHGGFHRTADLRQVFLCQKELDQTSDIDFSRLVGVHYIGKANGEIQNNFIQRRKQCGILLPEACGKIIDTVRGDRTLREELPVQRTKRRIGFQAAAVAAAAEAAVIIDRRVTETAGAVDQSGLAGAVLVDSDAQSPGTVQERNGIIVQ